MEFVDTHCHIQSIGAKTGEENTRQLWLKAGDLDTEAVINRAKEANVNKLICVGCDLGDSQLAIDFASSRNNVWASIGLHPHEAKVYADDKIATEEFKDLVVKNKVIAVGECGLDYYYEHSLKADQIKILEMQLDLATQNNLPVIFHVREAFSDFWPILDNFSKVKGVLHSFTDSLANLEEGLKRGLYFGVNGIATFAKNEDSLAMYSQIPLNSLLLETDAPFLTPVPHRGKINEPNMVEIIGQFLANLRGEDLSALAGATTQNATNLFGI